MGETQYEYIQSTIRELPEPSESTFVLRPRSCSNSNHGLVAQAMTGISHKLSFFPHSHTRPEVFCHCQESIPTPNGSLTHLRGTTLDTHSTDRRNFAATYVVRRDAVVPTCSAAPATPLHTHVLFAQASSSLSSIHMMERVWRFTHGSILPVSEYLNARRNHRYGDVTAAPPSDQFARQNA
jgi:hypothetical protein